MDACNQSEQQLHSYSNLHTLSSAQLAIYHPGGFIWRLTIPFAPSASITIGAKGFLKPAIWPKPGTEAPGAAPNRWVCMYISSRLRHPGPDRPATGYGDADPVSHLQRLHFLIGCLPGRPILWSGIWLYFERKHAVKNQLRKLLYARVLSQEQINPS